MRIKELAATNELPKGIEISLRINQIEATVSIGGNSNWQKNRLQIRVSPEASSEAHELFGALRQWAKTYQSPLWQRLWASADNFHWVAFVILLLVIGPSVLNSGLDSRKASVVAKAQALLVDGLQPGEQTEALEILLRLQTGLMPEIEKSIPAWFKVLFWGGLFVAVVLTIRPKVVLGLGRGADEIKRWRLWLRFVGVTVPGLVFTSFIWPHIEKLIRAVF